MATESWSPIHLEDDLCLVYGPRFGRFYLLQKQAALDTDFLKVVGLDPAQRIGSLDDPADRVAVTKQDLSGETHHSSARLRYGFLSLSRHIVPLRLAVRLIQKLAMLIRRFRGAKYCDDWFIARKLNRMEQGAGNCYPRALMTVFWLILSDRPCQLVVGALAPTRKMHVWCSAPDRIPYEPRPEHYLYQPLWTMTLTP